MKKICSLLLVATLAFSLAVPAFAYEVHGGDIYSYGGTEAPLPPELDGYPYICFMRYSEDGSWVFPLFYSSKPFFYSSGGRVSIEAGSDVRMMLLGDGVWKDWGDAYVSEGETLFLYVWANEDIYALDGSVKWSTYVPEFVRTGEVATECDGSTCPATDVNYDDVCDDCGLTLAYNLRQTPNSVELVVKHSDSLTLKYVYTETLAGTSFNAVYADDRVTVTFDNPVNHTQYKKVGDDWEQYSSFPNQYGSHVISLSGDASILTSDLDVYNTDGTLFFRTPLWQVVEKVTQGEMMNLLTETGGTMKTLVACGVGLMACLVVLSLFGKRSLIFRG